MLIDEAHDLADEWLAAAVQMVDPATKSLLVLYDDAQSIYQKSRRKLSFAKLGIEAKGRTEILKINYRNTTEVLALAMECADGILHDGRATSEEDMPLIIPQSAGRSGPLPTFHRFEGGLQEAAYVAGAIAELIAQGRSPDDIAVLSRNRRSLDTMRTAIERAGVACSPSKFGPPRATRPAGRQAHDASQQQGARISRGVRGGIGRARLQPGRKVEELRLLYVGMTRATHRLSLSAMGTSAIVDHVENRSRG